MTSARPGRPTGGRAPRRGLTGRALILAAVLVVLVLLLAAPMQRYLEHRSAVTAAQRQQQDLRQRVEDLQRQKQQWQDPAYVEQQARSRLQYAMPGDIVYQVVTPESGAQQTAKDTGATGTTIPGKSWTERLWGSVESADTSAATAR